MNSIAEKISLWNRTRKYRYFENNIRFTSETTVLDVGFMNKTGNYPAMNYLEKHYPYPQHITALGINGKDVFCRDHPLVRAVLYDGVNFPFGDKQFDIGWSNAVIEHVAGGGVGQLHFLKELLRTCKVVCFTTPNKHFPIELHTQLPFLHWLPQRIYDQILNRLGKPWADSRNINLLTKRQVTELCKAAGAKKIKIKGNRLCGFVMDYIVIME